MWRSTGSSVTRSRNGPSASASSDHHGGRGASPGHPAVRRGHRHRFGRSSGDESAARELDQHAQTDDLEKVPSGASPTRSTAGPPACSPEQQRHGRHRVARAAPGANSLTGTFSRSSSSTACASRRWTRTTMQVPRHGTARRPVGEHAQHAQRVRHRPGRDPQSPSAAVLYGSDAANGVIQIFTKSGAGLAPASRRMPTRQNTRSPTGRSTTTSSIGRRCRCSKRPASARRRTS